MTLPENKYKEEAKQITDFDYFEGTREIAWQSPSNIALIKYWGKRHFQIPQNPSLSFSLKNAFTETKVAYQYKEPSGISFDFYFEEKEHPTFKERINKYLKILADYFPFLNHLHLSIHSNNSFPHSSGIASSASAMSALALCICSIENDLFGDLNDIEEFFSKASYFSRLGSGSASRSLFSGFTIWGEVENFKHSTNEFAIQINDTIHGKFMHLRDAILITSMEKKKVSSSAGHSLMNEHPYAKARYKQANQNLNLLLQALKSGDEELFISIVENEALSLHALMLSSEPGFTLLNSNTWEIINAIRKFRKQTKIFLTFTLDAGPNVHLIYNEKDKKEIMDFINGELLLYCYNQMWIDDELGSGPIKLYR